MKIPNSQSNRKIDGKWYKFLDSYSSKSEAASIVKLIREEGASGIYKFSSVRVLTTFEDHHTRYNIWIRVK